MRFVALTGARAGQGCGLHFQLAPLRTLLVSIAGAVTIEVSTARLAVLCYRCIGLRRLIRDGYGTMVAPLRLTGVGESIVR